MKHHGRYGFSLAEIIASVALISIILGISITTGSPGSKGSASSMATVLAVSFRAAQARAQSQGIPVGIAFPSNGGTVATCQSFYRLEGQVFPRIVEVKRFATENPGVFFGAVHWAGRGKPSVESIDHGDSFILDAWGLDTEDPVLIFLPDGTITANGIAYSSGQYSVVASQGFSALSVTPPGDPKTSKPGASFELTAIRKPTTVSLSQEGDIVVLPGLPDGGDLSSLSVGPLKTVEPPKPEKVPTAEPEILSHLPYPQPVEEVDADAVVHVGGSLTLKAEAWSPSGTPLFASWQGPGAFSSPGTVAMKWNPVEGKWQSEIEWHPPEDAVVGDGVELDLQINDAFGNANATVDVEPLDVDVVPRLGLISYRDSAAVRQVFQDGSGDEKLESGSLRYPTWSPDSSKLLAVNGNNLELVVPGVGKVTTVTTEPRTIYRPKWSPDGTRVLYNSDGKLWVVNIDGTAKREIAQLPSNLRLSGGYGWHPNGERVIFGTLKTSSVWTGAIWTVLADGTGKRPLSDGSFLALYAAYSPILPSGEVKVAFYGYGGKYHGIFVVDEDFSTTPRRVHPSFWTGVSSIYQVGWSHDGQYVSAYGGPRTGGWSMKAINVTTKSTHEFADSFVDHTWGVWSPYETKIVFRGEGNSLTIADADGTNRKRITNGAAYEADWVR